MKLSVIILNYNVCAFLHLCLISVRRALKSIDAEIIVVDNASNDRSIELVSSEFPEVLLIRNDDNLGFSKGNNIGVNVARGEYLCILNPDTVIPEDFFINLINFYEEQANPGILGCQLIDGSGNFLRESKRHIPTVAVSFKKMIGLSKEYYASEIHKNSNSQVEILVGAMMFLKKSVFEDVQGFDESYFMYAEDVDLSYKVLKAGYQNFYLGSTSAIHFKGESTSRDSNYYKRFYGSMQLFYQKHFKQNLLLDRLVDLGIKVAPILRKKTSNFSVQPQRAVVISNKKITGIEEHVRVPITYSTVINVLNSNTLYVFDTEFVKFKSIIKFIQSNSGSGKEISKNIQVRFYIPSSRLLIGSDNSVGQGDVLII